MILEKKKREDDSLLHEKQINAAAKQIVASENKRIEDNQRQQVILEKSRKLEDIERQQKEKEAEERRNKGLKETGFDIAEHKRLNDITIPSISGLRQLTIPVKPVASVKGRDLGILGLQKVNKESGKGSIQLTNQMLNMPTDRPPTGYV